MIASSWRLVAELRVGQEPACLFKGPVSSLSLGEPPSSAPATQLVLPELVLKEVQKHVAVLVRFVSRVVRRFFAQVKTMIETQLQFLLPGAIEPV